MTLTQSSPTVSIIVAAYNRSNVLRCAIESALAGTFPDWEMIVVGDHCTDDTRAVAESFGDARIRFLNLPENTGGQSDPNNMGVSLARGRYLCFLNQDDLYFPDHLSSNIEYIERTQAELVWSPVAVGLPENSALEQTYMQFRIDGVSKGDRFDPAVFVIASSWFMRSTVPARVGPWLRGNEIYYSPSQEWLFRAWKKKIAMRFHPHISVICMHSGVRRNSYENREAAENERYLRMMCSDTEFLRTVCERAAIVMATTLRAIEDSDIPPALDRLGWAVTRKLCAMFGIHPKAVRNFLRFRSLGGGLAHHKSVIFQERRLRSGDTLRVGEPGVADYLKSGWHDGEGEHRWTSEEVAVMVIDRDSETPFNVLHVRGVPLFVPQAVEFLVNGNCTARRQFSSSEVEDIMVPVSTRETRILLSIRVERTISPKDLFDSPDTRRLGFRVVHVIAE